MCFLSYLPLLLPTRHSVIQRALRVLVFQCGWSSRFGCWAPYQKNLAKEIESASAYGAMDQRPGTQGKRIAYLCNIVKLRLFYREAFKSSWGRPWPKP